MKPILYIAAILLTFPSIGCRSQTADGDNLEREKYLNFLASIQNFSTFSYFTVVKVKNLNTGETKEICTKGNFVAGAIHRELNLDYDKIGLRKAFAFAKSRHDRYFEFKNKEALDNISFFEYKPDLLKSIQAKYDIKKAIEIIKKKKEFSISLSDDEMKAFAHLLFNYGYLTGENDCFGGTLQYVDRSKKDK